MRQREGRKWSCDVLYVKTKKKKNLQHVTCVPPCRNKIHMLIKAGPPRSQEDNCRPLSVSRDSKRRATNGLKSLESNPTGCRCLRMESPTATEAPQAKHKRRNA